MPKVIFARGGGLLRPCRGGVNLVSYPVSITAGEVEAFVDFPLPLKLGPCQSDKDWLLGGPGLLFFEGGGSPPQKHSYSSCSVDTHFAAMCS